MNISPHVRRIVFFSLAFACLCVNIAAQGKSTRGEDPFQNEAWNKADPNFVKKHSAGSAESSTMGPKTVRFVYLVPSDRSVRDDYKAAVADAALHLQDFYQNDVGLGRTFTLNDPIVEVYQTTHTASWYQTNNPGSGVGSAGYFWENSLNDGFGLTGGFFNDPDNRWIYYIDAEPLCNQYTGGTSGVALLHSGDLRGLNGESNNPPCGGSPDTSGKYRWIGGAGHELGHAFNLPHPPGCGSDGPFSGCTGGAVAENSLMWFGYAYYPITYFLLADKTTLTSTVFFSVQDLREPRFADFDNDRKSDLSVWRPSNGNWYINASTSGSSTVSWGSSGDKIVPGDYDGDRKTDTAVWRPSDQTWYIINSSNSTYTYIVYGSNGDIPVAADYDGDRITDLALWRPINVTWYIRKSATGVYFQLPFGASGDRPVAADYNGDKRTDIAVFRPVNATWYIHQNYLSYYYYTSPPANGNIIYTATNYGLSGDNNTPADYDGDGKADISVWRPSTGVWYYLASTNSTSYQDTIGQSGDVPVPGDYNNDDITDISVWRPSIGDWFIHPSGGGRGTQTHWGSNGDIPVESAYVR